MGLTYRFVDPSTVLQANAARPNEPLGFTPWFEHNWLGTWPGDNQTLQASEVGWVHGESNNFEIIDDPTASHGVGRSLRHTQFSGQQAGNTGGTYNLLSIDSENFSDPGHVRLADVYRSHWVYFEPNSPGDDWQFGSTHMRTFWWNRLIHAGQGGFNVSLKSPANANSQNWAHFRGPRCWYYPDETPQSHSFTEADDADVTDAYLVGEWYQMEWLIETGIPDVASWPGDGYVDNVRIRMWSNGDLKADETIAQMYLIRDFVNEHFGMVWLGSGTRSEDYFIRFGDIYISGRVIT